MAVTFDAGGANFVAGGTSVTIPHTVAVGANCLVVGACCANSTNFLTGGATCVFNGQDMGAPLVTNFSLGESQMAACMWILTAAGGMTHDGSSHSIVITPSGSAFVNAISASFIGVDQVTPSGTTVSTYNGSHVSPVSDNVTVGSGGMAVDYIYVRTTGLSLTLGGSQTRVHADQDDSVAKAGSSYLAAATNMSWTFTGTNNMGHMIIPLNAIAGVTITPPVGALTLTGFATAISNSSNPNLVPGVGTILITGFSPSGNVIEVPGLGTLTLNGFVPLVYGGFFTPTLKNNTGTILASETGAIVNIYNSTTGALIVQKTGVTSDVNGIMAISDPLLRIGTMYSYEVVLASNGRRLPTISL